MNKRIGTRALSVIVEALGCFFLYYGTTMMLAVPGSPGEHYLSWGRVVYGVAPTVLSLALFLLAGWFWIRAGGPASLGAYFGRALAAAVALVVMFWIGLIVVAHLQGRIP